MKRNSLKQSLTRKLLVLSLPLALLVAVLAPSAQAYDYHHGREVRHGYHHGYRHGYYGDRGYRHGYYGEHYHHGYWRYYHGRRFWYENGGYFVSPGGISINIGL